MFVLLVGVSCSELTEKGAWRIDENGEKYGGYYSQEDIKEIVEYAKERYITVIPEIELPGHSKAALATYPELSCMGGPFEVANEWGVHEDIYCAGNEKAFEFLEDVLDEVIELFPSEYIHIGGDEAPKARWEKCPKCQKRIKSEGLKNEFELQSYFIKRIEKYLQKKGKKIIGWDEILEGGLAPGATVQSWRGMKGALEAAKSGHDAIVSPTSHAYFDYSVKNLNLEQVYSFEPVPKDLSAKEANHIIGGECNMWTERAPQEKIDYMLFPRILAMAEVLWSDTTGRKFEEFHQRVQYHYKRLEYLGVNYGSEKQALEVISSFNKEKNIIMLEFKKGQHGIEFYYTLDGSTPNNKSNKYFDKIYINKSCKLKIICCNSNNIIIDSLSREFTMNKATAKDVTFENIYNEKYSGGDKNALTNSVKGGIRHTNGYWQGFQENDMIAIIDLGEVTQIENISIGFLQNINSWIFFPEFVEYFVSDDNKNFKLVKKIACKIPLKDGKVQRNEFDVCKLRIKGRYIKVRAKNIGYCPEWHKAAGGEAWIFVDEVEIY